MTKLRTERGREIILPPLPFPGENEGAGAENAGRLPIGPAVPEAVSCENVVPDVPEAVS